jgi:hypothetical protein
VECRVYTFTSSPSLRPDFGHRPNLGRLTDVGVIHRNDSSACKNTCLTWCASRRRIRHGRCDLSGRL